jgi:predicted NBD/HSP70 family sugar kinase
VSTGRSNESHSGRSGTNLPQLADLNEAVVLGWIRRSSAGVSRVELAQTTGLSPQAVSNICQRLLDDGVIMEAGKATSGFGKPRTLLALNPAGCYAIGVHLDPAAVTIVLLDFVGTVVARTSLTTAAADPPKELVATISRLVDGLIDGAAIDRGRILGIGIASPGPIDQASGTVLEPPLLTEWHHVPLRDQLKAATGLPALLDKDVVAAAVAERWAGEALQSRNFAFIYLGAGIGVGIVVDDVVVRGTSANAGDIGEFEVAGPDGIGTTFLGEMANPEPILKQAVRVGVFPSAPGKEDPLAVDEHFTELCRRAGAGDTRASAILDQAAVRIGGAARRIANLLDIDTVVFGGTIWSRVADRYLETMAGIIQATSITRDIHPIRVVGTALGEDVGAIGAACLVLDTKASTQPGKMLQTF